ncbi:MAG: hypothetical protein NZ895_03360 [Archaeoglobaceae archaeon]|nr:hypothetical protein [Archaeoglobaceae archaeon]MCX8152082.1 hypothetical protein [Archaeoglobaceae archaeon]MDW8013517.1 hypothetical protein [Archaeoglobaceae archaeon]
MALYLSLGLTAKQVSKLLAEIVEMIDKKMRDDEMLKRISEKFESFEAILAAYILGRVVGMSFAIKNFDLAKAIISDFGRYIDIFKKSGREELEKLIEKETLEEAFKDVERFKDVI